MRRRLTRGSFTLLLLGLLALGLGSCGELGFYRQGAVGQLDLLARRHDMAEMIADPVTPAPLRERLRTALAIRDFASRELLLPDNGSYRCYADLGRSSVVWNVVAAPEFSLDPIRWCFPIAGCVPYRGYYSREGAESFAGGLRQDGNDVYVYGVSAFSTLGWFDDPVLNTFINRPDWELAGVIFHELAHQKFYVEDDSDFNEAFATVIEEEGVRRWLAVHGTSRERTEQAEVEGRREAFLGLIQTTRQRLADLYASPAPVAAKRTAKAAIFAELRSRYQELKTGWNGFKGYDRWFASELNNARFVSINTYRQLVPAFGALLRESHGELRVFFAKAEELGRLPAGERHLKLLQLLSLTALVAEDASRTH